MVIDSSALLAILLDEPEAEVFARAVTADPRRLISAVTFLESSIVLAARKGVVAAQELDRLIKTVGATVVNFDEQQARLAQSAYDRFGKGRHPARLNLGDCCSYALAQASGEALLCKGSDFPQTDLSLVF